MHGPRMAGHVERQMNKEASIPSEKDLPETKNFVIRCVVEHASQDLDVEFMDIVQGYNQEDAKDFLSGWMADRGFMVKKWLMVGDIDRLRDLARNL